MSDNRGGARSFGFRERLRAWWEGYDLSALENRARPRADAAPPEGGAPRAGLDRWGKPLWTATRLQVAEKMWGEDFVQPGGHDHAAWLTLPIGLKPEHSVLELGVGLGGLTRATAKEKGSWVVGLESSPLLAREGMERSVKEGIEKRAVIELYDPESFVPPKRVDAVVHQYGFFATRDKDRLFDAMEAALKPKGHLVISDYVVTEDCDAVAIARWAREEPEEPTPWTVGKAKDAFAQRNLDLRIAEDYTDLHRAQILTAAQAFMAHLERHTLDDETKAAVLSEVELWARRVAAFGAGLRVYRFHALKQGE